jgi:hypothetical protein
MDATHKSQYGQLLMSLIPESGSSIGNVTLREKMQAAAKKSGEA